MAKKRKLLKKETGKTAKNLSVKSEKLPVNKGVSALKTGNCDEIFNKLVMASQQAVTILNMKGVIVFASERTVFLHGYSGVDELIGKNGFELVSPSHKKKAKETLKKLAGEKFIGGLELPMLRKDGSEFDAMFNAAVICDAAGNPFGFIVTTSDVSASKKIKKALAESEERYETLFELATDSIAVNEALKSGEPGRFVEANRAACRMTGYNRKELLGKQMKDVLEGERKERRGPIFSLLKQENAVMFEDVIRMKSGHMLNCEINAHMFESRNKNYIISVIRDISVRKRAEEKIKESEELYRKLIEMSPDAVVAADLEGNVIYMSETAVRMGGHSSVDSVIGRPVFDFVSPEERPRVIKLIENVFKEGFIRDEELVFVKNNGERFIGEFSATLTKDGTGKPISFLGIIRDVTEKKRAETELKESYIAVKKIMDGIIHSMEKLVEKKDRYTVGHQHRTALLASAIAKEIGLTPDQIECINIAAVIHDIGKIFVSGDILNKKGKLTPEEYEIIKKHPGAGYEVLKSIEFPWPVAEIILQHHERMDGSGYPAGLKGDDIYLESRIISVADVVEAITFERPYRPAFGVDKALDEITKNRGKLYDPEIADICVSLFKEKKFNW